MRGLFGVFLVLLWGGVGYPAYGDGSLSTRLENNRRKISVSAVIQTVSSLHQPDSVDHSAESSFVIAPSYALNPNYKVGVNFGFSQQLDYPNKSKGLNTKINLTRQVFPLWRDISMTSVAGLRLPSNVEERSETSYRGSALFTPTLLKTFEIGRFAIDSYYSVALTKNFHFYDRSAVGSANVSHSIVQALGVEKAVSKKWTLGLEGSFGSYQTYQSVWTNDFSLSESISFQQDKILFTFGHSNEADILKADGRSSNMAFFDQNTSVIFGTIKMIY